MPLHFAASAVGSGHFDRLRVFLDAYPDAVQQADERGMVPIQIALIHRADLDVMKLLIEFFSYRLLPQSSPRRYGWKYRVDTTVFHVKKIKRGWFLAAFIRESSRVQIRSHSFQDRIFV